MVAIGMPANVGHHRPPDSTDSIYSAKRQVVVMATPVFRWTLAAASVAGVLVGFALAGLLFLS
jgi:hypothetical protein